MTSPTPSPHATPPRLRRNVSPPITPDRPRLPAQVHLHRAASRRAMYAQRLAEHERVPIDMQERYRTNFLRIAEEEYLATGGVHEWQECLVPVVDIRLEPEVPVASPRVWVGQRVPVALPVVGRPVGGIWRVWGAMRGAFWIVWGRAGDVMREVLGRWKIEYEQEKVFGLL
ncbi:uncharacterized protein LAJ45_00969 [Morchella importuna]|uniref:uncharacterized protein n=1 Tax=Morchella importuna TaxID=1174673 RepID=UPI001E8DAF5A|nr:uncharacterized protein LAJ45_00969 [Morchella importuna]KAH8154442.1 hypothetical protein LAJ45_00969 [Morchella importuna]